MQKTVLGFIVLAVLAMMSPAPALATDAPTAVDLSQEPTGEAPQEVKVESAQRYAIWVRATNARFTLRVNDIPVAYKILRNDEVFDVSFNEWLKRGLNVVEINMERFNKDDAYDVRYQVYYQSPIQVVNGEKLVLYNSPDEVNLPLRQPVGVRTNTIPVLRIWQTDSVNLTGEEQQRLLETMNGLRTRLSDAMLMADNAFLASFDKASRSEIDRAYGRLPMSEEQILTRRRDLAAKLGTMANAQFEASPVLTLSALVFEPIGNEHLVMVSRIDGSPVIQVKRGDLVYTLDKPIFGSIGGVWELLR